MKPTREHYFYAEGWPVRIWMASGTLTSAIIVVAACKPAFQQLRDWRTVLWFFVATLLALAVGWFSSILLGWPILGPVLCERGRKNGSPFIPGDLVQVLCGPHRNRITRVYSSWQHESVRVDLGEQEKVNLRDIFCPDQLLRVDVSDEIHR